MRQPSPQSPPAYEQLSRQAHLWLVDADRLTGDALLDSYRHLLSEEEEDRYRLFRAAQARHEFLVGRALIRTTLSRYVSVDPAAWQIHVSAHGRPEIADPIAGRKLRFNLSHAQGLIACLVTLSVDSGVDVEVTDRAHRPLELAEDLFSGAEQRSLVGLPPSRQRHLFHGYWTLKEAYLKARGAGLSEGLERVSFSFPSPGEIAVRFDHRLADRNTDWQFGLYRRSHRYMLAVAIRKRSSSDFELVPRLVVPLTDRIEAADLEPLAVSPVRGRSAGDP